MRINEWNQRNQNAAKMNGPGGVQGKGNTKKLGDISTKSCKIKPEEDSFRSSLQKSMVQEEAMKAQVKKAEEAGRPGGQPLRQLEREAGQPRMENINACMERNALTAKEVPVRMISYGECDKVEVNVLEGYVLKAKEDRGMKGSGVCSVYVEKKSDDGTWKACVYDGISSRKDSRDEMERMAYMVASAGSSAKAGIESNAESNAEA